MFGYPLSNPSGFLATTAVGGFGSGLIPYVIPPNSISTIDPFEEFFVLSAILSSPSEDLNSLVLSVEGREIEVGRFIGSPSICFLMLSEVISSGESLVANNLTGQTVTLFLQAVPMVGGAFVEE